MAQYNHYSPVLRAYARCSNPKTCLYKTRHYTTEVVKMLDTAGGVRRGNITEELELVAYHKGSGTTRKTIKIAPEGFSSAFCNKCERYFTPQFYNQLLNSNQSFQCEYKDCRHQTRYVDLLTDLRSEDQKFLNPDNVKTSKWYHSTNQTDWLTRLQDTGTDYMSDSVLAHVGTKEAAQERVQDILKWISNPDETQYYLYELQLKPGVAVNPLIFADMQDEWPYTTGKLDKTPFAKNGVNRYLNEYEALGTISLIASPHLFEVSNVEPISRSR